MAFAGGKRRPARLAAILALLSISGILVGSVPSSAAGDSLLQDGGPNGDVGDCILPAGVWAVTFERGYANMFGTPQSSGINSLQMIGDMTLGIQCDGTTKIIHDSPTVWARRGAIELMGKTQQIVGMDDIPVTYTFSNPRAYRDPKDGQPTVELTASLAGGGVWGGTEVWKWHVTRNEGPDDPYWLSGNQPWSNNSPANAPPNAPAVGKGGGTSAVTANMSEGADSPTYLRLDPGSVYTMTRPPHPNMAWDPWPKDAGGVDAFWHPTSGYQDGAFDGFTMTPIGGYPDVTVRPTLQNDFLAKVGPVENTYVATVDWHKTKPKSVTFKLLGPDGGAIDQQDGEQDSDSYKATFPIGDKAAGTYSVSATATSLIGLDATKATPLTIVDNPHWAAAIGVKPDHVVTSCTSDSPPFGCEIYSGATDITWPKGAPTLPQVTIPDIVPFIGGKWGLEPLKMHVPVDITSDGGSFAYADVTGGGLLAFAGKELKVGVAHPNAGSRTRTNTSDAGVEFVVGQGTKGDVVPSSARLDMPEFEPIHKSVDLLSVIPGAHYAYDIPYGIGKFIHAVVPSVLDANLTMSLSGDAEFGLDDSKEIALTGGHVGLTPGVSVSFGPNLVVAHAQVFGTLSGQLDLTLAPKVGVADCELDYNFYLLVGFLSYQTTVPNPATPTKLTDCTSGSATARPRPSLTDLALLDGLPLPIGGRPEVRVDSGNDMLLAAVAASDPAQPQTPEAQLVGRDGWTPEATVPDPKAVRRPNARLETALVSKATAFVAAPAIAAGPNGTMAMTWVSEDPKLTRPQAFQVKLRLYDGKTWSEAIPVSDGSAETGTPSVAFDGKGNVLVAYMQNPAGASGYGQTLTAHSYDGAEIALAEIDRKTHAVTRQTVTQNQVPDLNPVLVATADGGVWLGWESSDATGGPLLDAAHWDGTALGAPEAVPASADLQSWRFAALDADKAAFAELWLDGKALGLATVSRGDGKWSDQKSVAGGLPLTAGAAIAYRDTVPFTVWSNGQGILGVSGAGAAEELSVSKLQPLAIGRSADGPSVLIGGPFGIAAIDADAAGGWGKPQTVVRAFSSLTSIGVVSPANGGWVIVRAATGADAGGSAGNPIPQAADIVVSQPANP